MKNQKDKPMTSIYEQHKLEEKELESRHQKEREQLRLSLKAKQALCPHPSWTRHEQLFYALGETYPGEMCDECGQQRHIG
jgi:hypothetical protein